MNEAAAKAKAYANGVRDGFEITLRLLLGATVEGGVPYRGPRPDELTVWARTALARCTGPEIDDEINEIVDEALA